MSVSSLKTVDSDIHRLYMWGSNEFGQMGNGRKGKETWFTTPTVRSYYYIFWIKVFLKMSTILSFPSSKFIS